MFPVSVEFAEQKLTVHVEIAHRCWTVWVDGGGVGQDEMTPVLQKRARPVFIISR